MQNQRKVCVSSILPASVDEVWDKLQHLGTLQYVAAPFASFESLDKGKTIWREGETTKYKLKLFGIFSLGVHTIKIIQFEKNTYTVLTNEENKIVPEWNHKIRLEIIDERSVRYTDEVELFAGWKTVFVYWWSCIFYRHRQKKWQYLLKKSCPRE